VNGQAADTLRLAVFVSGGGRTLENLLAWIHDGRLTAEVRLVVSSREEARGTDIARRAEIETRVVPARGRTPAELGSEAFEACRAANIDLVVLGGYLHLITIPHDFAGRVINIHPSLLPAFGGKGYHGMRVHEAVLARGCTISGCTVHLVDNEYDHGRVLAQRAVPVKRNDSAEALAARVFTAECELLPETVEAIRAGEFGPLPLVN
jgi:phosphoribosylglycinamide formyltransferase-1